MKFPTLTLDAAAPRDLERLRKKVPLYLGIGPYYFFGVFALIGPFIPMFIILLGPGIGKIGFGPIIFSFLFFEFIAITLLFLGNRIYQRRVNALIDGQLIKGRVVKHARNFVFWKGQRNYQIGIEYIGLKRERKQVNVEWHRPTIHQYYPIGTEVLGLLDASKDAICFPQELGFELQVVDNPRIK